MKNALAATALIGAALIGAAHAATGVAAETALQARVVQVDGWAAWNVPMVTDAGSPCCYWDDHGRKGTCDLDGHNHGFSTSDEPRKPIAGVLTVYAHATHGHIDDVRAYDAECPVRSAGAIRRIDDVDSAQSLSLLESWINGSDATRDDLGLAAIAYHADAAATRVLASRAEPMHSRKDREDALFWLGQARGPDGAAIVERYATTDGDPKLREHAIFALSQSHADDPYARIHAIALSDRDGDVRSQALFWMSQMKDPRAAKDITAVLTVETSSSVREQAVFALSQLGDDAGVDALIALLRGNYPRDVKKQALFWLGESGSPRAMQFFDEALTKSR